MIVTFCGHARFSKSEEYEQQILAFLEEKVEDFQSCKFSKIECPREAIQIRNNIGICNVTHNIFGEQQ